MVLLRGHVDDGRRNEFQKQGGQELVRLDDGSRVSLNTDSRIAILYSDGERRVRLDRGEAMFEVARNPARPFVVIAGNKSVTAIGTSFIVRKTGGVVTVTLPKSEKVKPRKPKTPENQ